MKRSKYEMETILLYNEEEPTASCRFRSHKSNCTGKEVHLHGK